MQQFLTASPHSSTHTNGEDEMASGRQRGRRAGWGTFWRGPQAFIAQTDVPGVETGRKPLASGEFCAGGRNVDLGLGDGSGVRLVGGHTFVMSKSERWDGVGCR